MRIMKAPNFGPDNPKYWDYVTFPAFASIKYDGIRCHVENGICLSTTNKPIPNIYIQEALSMYEGYDGEIVCGSPNAPNCYNRTQSMVMSQEHKDDFKFYVFDLCSEYYADLTFVERMNILHAESTNVFDDHLCFITHSRVESVDELLALERHVIDTGYEGLMINMPHGYYKQGRATPRDQLIYKLKRYLDAEGKIVGFLEAQENTNESYVNELGLLKKRDTKDAKKGLNQVGTFIVSFNDDTIHVGPGKFTHEQREDIWINRDDYMGKLLKFKYLPVGIKNKPRHPVALGFRSESDL